MLIMIDTDNKYIDFVSGLARVGNNEALYRKFLAKFEASIDISAFDDALAAKEYEKAGEIVHVAKGVAGNLSLAAFYDESAALMDQFRDGGVPVQANVDAFKSLYYETVQAIREYLAE